MAVIISATRTSTLFNDQDGDGVFDPGDVVLTRIRITNSGTDPATGISVTDSLSGVTLVAGSVQVTPIAYDDAFNLTGNTPITINAAQGLLLNDVDPDGAGGNAGLTVTSVDITGTQGTVAFNANGSFTFTPTTGFVGITSFKYYVQDAQGRANVTEGIVTMTVTDKVWYVDNTYGGENGASDGSYLKPFTSLTPLNNNGVDADGANDTIFVYHNGGNYTAGITLEAGQKLLGDGVGLFVNGHNIGGTERTGGTDNVTTNAVISQNSGTVITLSTDNTVRGLTLDSNGAAVVGMADGNGSVTTDGGTLTVNTVSFTGSGKAIDIDQGGNLAVTVDSLTSSGSTGHAVQLAGTASSGTGLITGNVTITGGTIGGSDGILLGAAGGLTASSGGDVNLTYGGVINGTTGTAVEIQDRTGGTATFNGNITHSGTAGSGIAIDTLGAGTVNFNGQSTSITTTTGVGVNLTNNSGGTINFTPAAGGSGFDVSTGAGKGLVFTGGGTLNVTGTANSVATTTGQVLDLQNGTMGTSGIQFATLGSGSVAAGNAINIVNLDAAGAGTFQGGAVTIGGASGDGINITSSDSTFTFTSATIGSGAGSPISGDGIEINGQTQTQGAVTFSTVNVNGTGGVGVHIAGATNAVNINGGSIGATNDSFNDGVRINGGTGAVTVAATVSQSSGGFQVVDVTGHSGGTIAFSGNVTAGNGGGGISLSNNSGGAINFTGDVSLTTGTLTAFNFTNNGATGADVTLSGGAIDITTTSGTGINATNTTTVGAGSLTITGNDNVISSTTGRAINIDGVTANVTLEKVAISGGGTTTGVFLKNTGASGQFLVTGNGTTDDSGGIIQNIDDGGTNATLSGAPTTGTGYYFENVSNVSLSNIKITGAMGNFAIRGENVNNFTLRDSVITPTAGSWFGDNESVDEGAIRFGTENNTSVTGLKGTALFEGNTIGGGYENNLSVFLYGANTLNMTVKDSATTQAVFNSNNTNFGDDSLHVESGSTGNLTLTVTGVAFNGARGDQLQTIAIGNTTQTISINNNTFLNGHTNIVSGGGGVTLLGGDTAATSNVNITYDFSNNTIKGAKGDALRAIYTGTAGTISGTIVSNTIGTHNGALDLNSNGGSIAGGSGIDAGLVRSAGTGSLTYALRIEGNTIRDIQNAFGGIILTSNMQGTVGTARLEATILNNTVQEVGGDVLAGMYTIVGGQSSVANSQDAAKMGLVINNNTFTAGAATGGAAILFDQLSGNAQYYFPGYTVNANSSHGEFRPSGGGGTASSSLDAFIDPGNNLINGPFPTVAGQQVDANQTTNIGNQAFVLAVPMLAAPQAGLGWEDLVVKTVAPTPDSGGAGSDTPANAGGDMGAGGAADTGGSGGSGDTGGTGSGTPAPVVVDDGVISAAELDQLVEAAIQRWIDAGATAAQVEAMRAVKVGIVDMAGIYVGASTAGIINIDEDGAGRGWFVDPTPGDDSEYEGSGTRLTADAGGPAEGRLDLLTVLIHELGHQIGLGDEYVTSEADDVMFGYMNVGERRLPAQGEADGAVPGSVGATAYALTPVSVGTLPPNKTVDVFFQATIDPQTDKFITNLNNDSTISGSNFTTVVANEQNTLDSLTLGSTVYIDANLNGLFDAGEGRSGVALELYADTDDSGGWNAGDVLLGNTTTDALGTYSFAGLAPGKYIVVVTAANFANGAQLDDLLIVPGVAADPDNNVDNDNNGVAATGGAVASQTITLAYNDEPDGTPQIDGDLDADTNHTLDFGFAANQPPVANDDGVSVAEDSGANDLTSQLLGNDTDPENDTRTITSATQGANGTTSVVGGVLTYTPNANYNGSDSFTYTISDGQGHDDTATVTVTVTAVNDPVTGTAPTNANLNEDSTDVAITGMSISDVDSTLAPAGVYDVTLSATNGTLTLTTTTGLTFGAGDGSGDSTMTFHGTLADINAALATAKYTPTANYNGSAQITLQVTDKFGGVVATGTGTETSDSDVIAVTVNSVNDAPEGGTGNDASAGAGATYTFLTSDFSDGLTDPLDSPANGFGGVKITTLPPAGAGTIKLGGVAISAGAVITKTQLDNGELTFDAAAGTAGTSPTFTFQVQDDGGVLNGGVDLDPTPNTFTLNIGSPSSPPAVDLNGAAAGSDNTATYTEQSTPAVLAPDLTVTDVDDTHIESATISIGTGFQPSLDYLFDNGATSAPGFPISASYDNMTGVMTLTGSATLAQYEGVLRQIRFESTSENPTTTKVVNWTVNDGSGNSATVSTTVTTTGVNDKPVSMSLDGDTSTFTEGGAAVKIDVGSNVFVGDADSPNFDLGSLTIALNNGVAGEDRLGLDLTGAVTLSGTDVVVNGTVIGTLSQAGGAGGGPLKVDFNSNATHVRVNELIRALTYFNSDAVTPDTTQRSITLTLVDGDGTALGGTDTMTNSLLVNVNAADDAPTAQPDAVSTAENVTGTGDLFANNGSGADTDPEGDPITISAVNGSAGNVDTEITLASGAKLKVNADGTYSYNPNGKFNWLTDNTSGAVNTSTVGDTFQYTVTGGNTVTVTVTVNGVAGPGDHLMGDGTDNTITGTPQNDFFLLQQGGDDTVYGLAGDDIFYFGSAFDGDDIVDANGGGKDVVVLQGNYTLTLSATNLTGVESISLKGGDVTFFGDVANNFYDYDLTTVDQNVAAGAQLIVNGSSLRVGEDFTFDGSDESNGKFLLLGGHGVDTLTGGDGNDIFVFEGTRWGASDSVDGGLGRDAVVITAGNGLTHIDFGPTSLIGVESITVSNQYSSTPTATPDYEFVLDNGNVAAGQTLIVNGFTLTDPGQTISVDGSDVQDGKLMLIGGAGGDTLIGGDQADILYGAGSSDNLTGGAGSDVFRYDSIADSNASGVDEIEDFNLGDLIDLSRIDANSTLGGDQAFNFIGGNPFSNTAGELRIQSMGGNLWLVQGDTDGINGADFYIMVNTDGDPIVATDFNL